MRLLQASDGGRETELKAELQGEQRELDSARFKLLLEHQAILQPTRARRLPKSPI